MIKGIGTDIIEISRIKRAISKPGFLDRVYTQNEIEEYHSRKNNCSFLAGLFAAKEAFSKALGTGMRGISFLDIEVKNDHLGKPSIHLLKDLGIPDDLIHLSISHSKENAIAYCIILK